MSQYIETIRSENGVLKNLHLHLERMNLVRKRFYGEPAYTLRLFEKEIRDRCGSFNNTVEKIRVLYSNEIVSVEKSIYIRRNIESLMCVEDDTIVYTEKSADRETINKLFGERQDCDDVIIVKNGFITDSSFTNLAFERGDIWYTPALPLLKGVRRRGLLENGFLQECDIRLDDLLCYRKVMLINAMLEPYDIVFPVDRIIRPRK